MTLTSEAGAQRPHIQDHQVLTLVCRYHLWKTAGPALALLEIRASPPRLTPSDRTSVTTRCHQFRPQAPDFEGLQSDMTLLHICSKDKGEKKKPHRRGRTPATARQ